MHIRIRKQYLTCISSLIYLYVVSNLTQALPVDNGEARRAVWAPETGSMEDWYRCHSLPCDEYFRVQEKIRQVMEISKVVDTDDGPAGDSPLVSGTLDGCIWLTEEQVDWIINQKNEGQESRTEGRRHGKRHHDRSKRKVIDFAKFPTFKWPIDRPIVYKFDGKHDESQREIVRMAFRHWEEKTCMRFSEVDTNADVQDGHVMITRDPSGCHSFVGKVSNGPQQLNLYDACLWEFGIPVHEIGHTLGLWHEQMRFDRDNYIQVLYKNLGFYQGQFARINETVGLGVPYDYGSVMHYAPRDGTINGELTMQALDPLFQSSMGQRTGLSFFDAKIINRAYCTDVCRGRAPMQPCENGGYQDPNNCDRCMCPDGYAPPFCQQVAPSKHAACGGQILLGNAASQMISSPNFGNGAYNDDTECNWVIKAPIGSHVQLEFVDKFGVYCHNQRQCDHWVEVKHKADKGMYGPRFCCYDTPSVRLVSEKEEMAVIFKSNFTVTNSLLARLNVGFRAIVRSVDNVGNVDITTIPTPSTTKEPTTTKTTTTTTTTTTPTSTSASGVTWSCNFEQLDGKLDWCGITQERNDEFDWTIQTGPTPSDETGPLGAYNGKYYIFIEASNPRQPGDRANILLPPLSSEGAHCLQWMYHMYGFHINTLQVYIQRDSSQEVIWSQKIPFSQQTMDWLSSKVQVNLSTGLRIGFTGIRGEEFSGDIAVDAISLAKGFC